VSLPNHDDSPTLLSESMAAGVRSVLNCALTVPGRLFCGLQYQGLYGLPVVALLTGPALAAFRRRPRLAMACAAGMICFAAAAYALGRSLTDASRSMPYLNQ